MTAPANPAAYRPVEAIFASPSTSAWGSPLWADVEPRIVALAEAFGRERTVVTRFVADPGLGGSWGSYYDEWGFALVPDDDPLYAVVPALRSAAGHGVTAGTFGKWNADLRRIVGAQPRMALAGVSTDCCVTAENGERALAAMELFGPQITVVR